MERERIRLRLGLVELAPDISGGAATYGRAIRHLLRGISDELGIELVRLVNDSNRNRISGIDDSVINYRKWSPRLTQYPLGQTLTRIRWPKKHTSLDLLPKVLLREKVDLAWFLAPNRVIEQVRETPFVMTVWDLAHREVQGFPEFNSGRGWAQRESWYKENIGRAFHVVTDSTHTGLSLERIYGLFQRNWSSVGLPFPPDTNVDDALAKSIESPYFYYPASFWPHKNHKVLIDALALLDNSQACLVFTGTDEGMEGRLRLYASEEGLTTRVKFLGRVTDAEVQGLISQSVGVLMPSLLGPTNYPPLEALRLGVPSVVSTEHSFDDLPDGALVKIDGTNTQQWANEMARLLRAPGKVPSISSENESARIAILQIIAAFQKVQNSRLVN